MVLYIMVTYLSPYAYSWDNPLQDGMSLSAMMSGWLYHHSSPFPASA